jgi:hypothetical protein
MGRIVHLFLFGPRSASAPFSRIELRRAAPTETQTFSLTMSSPLMEALSDSFTLAFFVLIHSASCSPKGHTAPSPSRFPQSTRKTWGRRGLTRTYPSRKYKTEPERSGGVCIRSHVNPLICLRWSTISDERRGERARASLRLVARIRLVFAWRAALDQKKARGEIHFDFSDAGATRTKFTFSGSFARFERNWLTCHICSSVSDPR